MRDDQMTRLKAGMPVVPHYQQHPSGVEPKDIAGEYTYNVGTALVYLWRSPYKHESPIDDLRKARDHIEFEIQRLERGKRT